MTKVTKFIIQSEDAEAALTEQLEFSLKAKIELRLEAPRHRAGRTTTMTGKDAANSAKDRVAEVMDAMKAAVAAAVSMAGAAAATRALAAAARAT